MFKLSLTLSATDTLCPLFSVHPSPNHNPINHQKSLLLNGFSINLSFLLLLIQKSFISTALKFLYKFGTFTQWSIDRFLVFINLKLNSLRACLIPSFFAFLECVYLIIGKLA